MNNFDFPAIFCASILFVSILSFGLIFIIIDIKDNKELKGRTNEKNLQVLKKYLKKSKAIDPQQADRINTLLEESISILRQKKISQEKVS